MAGVTEGYNSGLSEGYDTCSALIRSPYLHCRMSPLNVIQLWKVSKILAGVSLVEKAKAKEQVKD